MTNSPNQLVEHFFRHESANLVAVMTRAFGLHRIDLVEDMVQAAMLEAMHAWKQGVIPENPAGWIHRVAKNRVLDALRREKSQAQALASAESVVETQGSDIDRWLQEECISDSLLRMMFVCCHPSIDRKSQIAMILKTLCGFGVSEIARGLLLQDEAAKKRIQRAKRALAAAEVQIEIPGEDEIAARLHVVHDALYLLFNEGYSSSCGSEAIRDDVCEEAVRLCHLLCESTFATTSTKALLALLLFHAARLESRTDHVGAIVLLEDQDRSKWDRGLIAMAQFWLAKSKTDQPTTYHFEASIAMLHCVADSVAETDWDSIVQLYGRLRLLRNSPLYTLNQAIAVGQAGDTSSAMKQLRELRDRKEMQAYLLLDCAIGRIHELNGDRDGAINAYLDAMAKDPASHEKDLIEYKLKMLT